MLRRACALRLQPAEPQPYSGASRRRRRGRSPGSCRRYRDALCRRPRNLGAGGAGATRLLLDAVRRRCFPVSALLFSLSITNDRELESRVSLSFGRCRRCRSRRRSNSLPGPSADSTTPTRWAPCLASRSVSLPPPKPHTPRRSRSRTCERLPTPASPMRPSLQR